MSFAWPNNSKLPQELWGEIIQYLGRTEFDNIRKTGSSASSFINQLEWRLGKTGSPRLRKKLPDLAKPFAKGGIGLTPEKMDQLADELAKTAQPVEVKERLSPYSYLLHMLDQMILERWPCLSYYDICQVLTPNWSAEDLLALYDFNFYLMRANLRCSSNIHEYVLPRQEVNALLGILKSKQLPKLCRPPEEGGVSLTMSFLQWCFGEIKREGAYGFIKILSRDDVKPLFLPPNQGGIGLDLEFFKDMTLLFRECIPQERYPLGAIIMKILAVLTHPAIQKMFQSTEAGGQNKPISWLVDLSKNLQKKRKLTVPHLIEKMWQEAGCVVGQDHNSVSATVFSPKPNDESPSLNATPKAHATHPQP